MKPAAVRSPDKKALEDVGRATLQIVHDLKNQLNGLKLYATFLRKRLEPHENLHEERDTLKKLIAGLDRAADDMTALVRFSQPIELRRQPRTDLRKMIEAAVREVESRRAMSLPLQLKIEIEPAPFYGELDSTALSEALRVITEEALGRSQSRTGESLSLKVSKAGAPTTPCALIEWRRARLLDTLRLSVDGNRGVRVELAARIIEAHSGTIEYDSDTIQVRLPLSA